MLVVHSLHLQPSKALNVLWHRLHLSCSFSGGSSGRRSSQQASMMTSWEQRSDSEVFLLVFNVCLVHFLLKGRHIVVKTLISVVLVKTFWIVMNYRVSVKTLATFISWISQLPWNREIPSWTNYINSPTLGCVKFPKSFRNFTASGFSAGIIGTFLIFLKNGFWGAILKKVDFQGVPNYIMWVL